MTDEPTILGVEKTLRLGDHLVPITEPLPIQTVVADCFTDIRLIGTTVAIGLATLHRDGTGGPEARMCARLRVSLETLSDIQRVVANMLDGASKAAKFMMWPEDIPIPTDGFASFRYTGTQPTKLSSPREPKQRPQPSPAKRKPRR